MKSIDLKVRATTTLFAAALVVLSLAARPAQATTITAAGSVIQNTIPGGGLGTSGYIFYTPVVDDPSNPNDGSNGTVGPDLLSQPTFVSSLTDAANTHRFVAPKDTYSELPVGGTNYDTGLIYRTDNGNLLTISLNGLGLPAGGFQLGLLGNNYNYNGVGRPSVSLTVTANGSGSTQTQSIKQDQGAADFQTNRFYLFDVTNLTPNDTITISGITGVNGGDGLLLGGITFSAVPEPTTFGLAGMALVGVLGRRVRRTA